MFQIVENYEYLEVEKWVILSNLKISLKQNEFLIYESEYWIWSLRSFQATLGSGILSLKRECLIFSGLIKEEFCGLNIIIIKVIENTLKETVNHDVLNYLMLMMVDKQVHYHVIPRYERTIEFEGILWKD